MSNAQHTPEESWATDKSGFNVIEQIAGGGAATVALVQPHARMKERAALIASAPDLLAALEALVTEYVELVESGDCGFWDPEEVEVVIAARTALERAKP